MRSFKQTVYAVFFMVLFFSAGAQNGAIIKQTPYTIADSSREQLEKMYAPTDSILRQVDFFSITYLSEGLKVNGYLAIPKKMGHYPSIIYNRGGNREQGSLNDLAIIRMLGTVASWGYVCIASQYRGNGGSEGKEEFGGRDVNDVLNLIPCLDHIRQADTSRIGMFGWSRGGMMTYLALTKTSRMKAAVIGSGMADAFGSLQKRPDMNAVFAELVPEYEHKKDSLLRSRSALYWVDKISPATPLLLLAGTADWRVSPEDAMAMASKLYALKHPFRFELFEGGQHSLSEHTSEVNHAIQIFLDKYVRDKDSWPSMELHGN